MPVIFFTIKQANMEISEAYKLLSKTDSRFHQELFCLLKKAELENYQLRAELLKREIELCSIAQSHNVQPLTFEHPEFN